MFLSYTYLDYKLINSNDFLIKQGPQLMLEDMKANL